MSNPTALAGDQRVPRPRRGSVYRGDAGMWSWVAHRITGVLTFFFLFAHVLDTALVRVSPEAYNTIIETYKNPLVNLMEVGLVAAVHRAATRPWHPLIAGQGGGIGHDRSRPPASGTAWQTGRSVAIWRRTPTEDPGP